MIPNFWSEALVNFGIGLARVSLLVFKDGPCCTVVSLRIRLRAEEADLYLQISD